MNQSRILTATSLVAASALALTGCSTSGGGGGDATSLTMWHNSADSPALLQMYKDFEAKTGIAIELVDIPSDSFETTTTTKWATGDRPDLLEYHPTLSLLLALNPKQNMQDLSDMAFVKESGNIYDSMGSYEGSVYAAITGFPTIFGLYYNKQVFAENGLQAPKTFDDLTALCSALKPTGVAPIWESGGSAWPTQVLPLMYIADSNEADAYGSAIASNTQSLDDPNGAFVKGLEAYQQLGEDACFNADATSATFEDGLKAVYDGKAAMTALHSDTYASLLADAGGDADLLSQTVGFVPVSASAGVGTWAGGPLGTYYAPKTGDSGKESAAKKFIEYATGEGYQKLVDDAKAFPLISTATAPAGFSALQESFNETYQNGSTVAFNSNVPGFGAFVTETSKLLAGQTTPADAAKSMQTQVEQAAKAAGLSGW